LQLSFQSKICWIAFLVELFLSKICWIVILLREI
jgi:hypothetical protein